MADVLELSGCATVYGSPVASYANVVKHYGARPLFLAGAFHGVLARKDTVELRVNHQRAEPAIASTAAGSLTLFDAEDGLYFVARMAGGPWRATFESAARNGAFRGCSVGWSSAFDRGEYTDGTFQIREAMLREVSIVLAAVGSDWPAFGSTWVRAQVVDSASPVANPREASDGQDVLIA